VTDVASRIVAAGIGAVATALLALVGYVRSRRRWKLEVRQLELEVQKLELEIQGPQQSLPRSASHVERMEKLSKGIRAIVRSLQDRRYRPDALIAFNRSGATLASMLAVNLKIDQVLLVPRARSTAPAAGSTTVKSYKVGELLTLKKDQLNSMKLLAVFMLVETTKTINDGKAFLASQGITAPLELATMYITSGARNLLPDAVFAYETNDPRGVLDRLPWAIDGWDFV